MKKVWILVVLLALGGCVVGNFDSRRQKLYGHDGISQICETDPGLCEDPNNDEW